VAVNEADGGSLAAEAAGFVAMVEAGVTDLADLPDPEARSRAARRWEECQDSYWEARCRLGEADALLRGRGDRDRAAMALSIVVAAADALGAVPLAAAARSLAQRGRLEVTVQGNGKTGTDHGDRSDPLAHAGLTPREVEVLQLVVRGLTNRQIAEDLYISDKTASVHVTNVLRKLGVDSRFAAADLARRVGWEPQITRARRHARPIRTREPPGRESRRRRRTSSSDKTMLSGAARDRSSEERSTLRTEL